MTNCSSKSLLLRASVSIVATQIKCSSPFHHASDPDSSPQQKHLAQRSLLAHFRRYELTWDEAAASVNDKSGLVEEVNILVDVEALNEIEGGLVKVEDLRGLKDSLDEQVPEPGLQPIPQ